MVNSLQANTFDEAIKNATQPVVVDFWAEWCGPCRMFSPIVDEVAEEHADKVVVYKLNIDEAQDIAARYGVMSIPTLILYENGEPASKLVGVQSKEAVEAFIGI